MRRSVRLILSVTACLVAHLGGCHAGKLSPASPASGAEGHREDAPGPRYEGTHAKDTLLGQASYYADSLAGNRTASGERYDPRALTAAHRTLPFGTVVRVVRADGKGEAVIVRITDRGPFAGERRIIDLSRAAAERLQMIRAGVLDVRVEILEYGKKRK